MCCKGLVVFKILWGVGGDEDGREGSGRLERLEIGLGVGEWGG